MLVVKYMRSNVDYVESSGQLPPPAPNKPLLISIVVPCYNEQDTLPIFYQTVVALFKHQLRRYRYELIFIDDGSRDDTISVLKKLVKLDNQLFYISFSRNFGKEAAIYAGLLNTHGDYVAVMDVDMQDPPSLLPDMLAMLLNGQYDCVATRREDRGGEPIARSYFAKWFYRIINRFSDASIVDGARDFRLMKRKMVDVICTMGEYNRFSKGIFSWVGFRTHYLSYPNHARITGSSKWSFWQLFKYAIDGIINFSQLPLNIALGLGVFMMGIAGLVLLIILIRLLLGSSATGDNLTIGVLVLTSGIQLFCLGIMGQYIAKIYLETKHRPIYIVSESNLTHRYPLKANDKSEEVGCQK